MDLWDIKERAEWQAELDRIARDLDIHTALMDAEGKVVLGGGEYNPLCSRIRSEPTSLTAVCSQTNQAMLHAARTSREVQADLCEGGMYKVVVPVFDGEELLGIVTACGLGLADEPLDAFLLAKILGSDEDEAERFAGTVSVVDAKRAREVRDALVRCVSHER